MSNAVRRWPLLAISGELRHVRINQLLFELDRAPEQLDSSEHARPARRRHVREVHLTPPYNGADPRVRVEDEHISEERHRAKGAGHLPVEVNASLRPNLRQARLKARERWKH